MSRIAAPLEEDDDLEDTAALEEEESDAEVEAEGSAAEVSAEHAEGGVRRRRRRRRRGRNGGGAQVQPHHPEEMADAAGDPATDEPGELSSDELDEEAAGENGSINRNEPQRDGERRRRRRGRRGGRRNRPERIGEAAPLAEGYDTYDSHESPTPPQELTGAPPTEAELREAVADLDAAPPFPAAVRSSEPPVVESTPSAPVSQPEPPRRRSTVREPAPIVNADAPQPAPVSSSSPPPQPVITEVGESESTDKPRRSGWWSRRFAGG